MVSFLRFNRLLITAFAALLIQPAFSQVTSLPTKEIGGKKVYYYEVKPGETLYSLSKNLGVSQSIIEKENPSVKTDGLKAGQILYFSADSYNSSGLIHEVKSKETVYGIARQYGITQKQLLDWNPSVRDGIRPGQKLIVSAPESIADEKISDMSSVSDNKGLTYTIKEGESLYRIASEHGLTVTNILDANPGLDRDNYKAGTKIKLPELQTNESESSWQPENQNWTTLPLKPEGEPIIRLQEHKVAKKETFFSISHQYGITVEQLEKANPGVGVIREGMVLKIPLATTDVTSVDNLDNIPLSQEVILADEPDSSTVSSVHNSIDISLVLPLMLDDSSQSKQAQLYTEFYKGFLVGVDSLRNVGVPLNINVYDTKGTMAGLRSLLSDPTLSQSRIIIAPDDANQLDVLLNYGKENNIDILNLFVVNHEGYLQNSFDLQGNIPHEMMYDKAIRGMIARYPDAVPVILSRKEGPDDKKEYINELKNVLQKDGIEYKEIKFDGLLEMPALKELDPAQSYIFIPESGRQVELNRIIPGLLEYLEQVQTPESSILAGYPEWITFRGETLSNMHRLNSVVYSRFYTVPDDYLAQRVDNAFEKWYGEPMANFVPKQGLFGFDTAMFLIRWLSDEIINGNTTQIPVYHGVQNGFDFKTVSGDAGKVNNSLYLINYRPSGVIDKIAL